MARVVEGSVTFMGTPANMPQLNTVSAPLLHDAATAALHARRPRRGAILVLEDRYDVRQGMAQLLEMHGFLVVDAAAGEQALGHLRTDPRGFALILLDLMMPGPITGSEFRRRQLAEEELSAIPAVVVSATEPDPALTAQLRADAWVAKPFRFDELLAIVKQYVTPEAGAFIAD